MGEPFPSDTHPADDLDLEELVSDFGFGRPCHIPAGIVGDATRTVFRTHWPALLRTVRAYRKRVDELSARVGDLEARLDAANGRTAAKCRELMAARRAADDWRDIAEARDREAKAEAHPPIDRYRVQVWDAADADLPSWGWSSISSARDTADEAVAVMARRRERRPEFGPMRVIRVRESYTVVATEDQPPPSTETSAVRLPEPRNPTPASAD